MEAERDDVRGQMKDASGACPAAHERAVVTVRLTILLLIIGFALFLFTDTCGSLPIFGGLSCG
jgi:hypothetical protein